jgi:hypothetical protein|tara:strand:- start:1829 stop:2026 length:198 start_codon:yes stop_codon:yes gene_type:complete
MTASRRAKEYGLGSLKELAAATRLSSKRLNSLCDSYPEAFRLLCTGLVCNDANVKLSKMRDVLNE